MAQETHCPSCWGADPLTKGIGSLTAETYCCCTFKFMLSHVPVVLKYDVCPDPDTLPRPEAGDVWVLRNILHDWSDADCQRILSAIRAAVGATPMTLTLVEVCTLRVLACGMPYVAAARPGGCRYKGMQPVCA